MSEQSFEELLKEEGEINRIHNGAVVTGTVIYVKENEAVLNIGGKADGILPKSEYSNDPQIDLTEALHEGDKLEVKVLKTNDGDGQVALSYKRLSQDRSNKLLEEAFENKTVLTGKVTKVVSAGLTVECEGAQVFIPASLVSDTFERNLEKYMDQEIEFVLTEYNPRKRRIVGDRKQLIVERKASALKELLERISVGQIVTGKVKNLTDFGAFIDLGGADGLLHISEMTWGRIDNPKKLFKVGQEVETYIKEINAEEGRIALSAKFPDKNPWTEDSPYSAGKIVTGKVVRMTEYGAFVELEPCIDALLHVSQIAHERIEKPADVLKVGQEITAQVIDYNPEERKISISMKALLPLPEAAPKARAAEEESRPVMPQEVIPESTVEIPAEVAEAVAQAEEGKNN